MRRNVVFVLALAAGILLPSAGTTVAAAEAPQVASDARSIGIRLLEAPGSAGDDPRASTYLVDHLKPGTTLTRQVEVVNSTDSRQSIVVYPGAATIRGGSLFPAEGRTPSELTRWTTVDRPAVPLEPGQHSAVEVTITVPKDASPGERYGAIWAEIAGPVPQGDGVNQLNRVGVGVYLSVGPGAAPASNFVLDALVTSRDAAGVPAVVAYVRNTGGRALDLSGSLTLTDGPGGLSVGPFPATLGVTLAPGDASPVTVPLDRQIPDGPWTAELTLNSGLLEKTTNATVTFPVGQGSIQATVASSDTFPWLPIITNVLSTQAALYFLLLLLRRLRPEQEIPAGDEQADHAADVRPPVRVLV